MSHTVEAPFKYSSGPRDAKIALVGEAWGQQEQILKLPFVGQSGQLLTQMLKDGGLDRKDCFLTNVLPFHPPSNNLDFLCTNKAEVGDTYKWPSLKQGKYLRWEYVPELVRLAEELRVVRPNLVICLGATACWAILNSTKIGAIRGAITESTLLPGQKCLPTYHPAGVMREWAWRVVVVSDFMKARREAEFPEIVRPRRWVLTEPSLSQIAEWASRPASIYSVDIETAAGHITCIGFARNTEDAIVIRFHDASKPGASWWPTAQEEGEAWKLVGQMLHSDVPKLFQNGMFDIGYLYRVGFRPKNCAEDTMLLSHALWPEMKKGLGFLASVHANEASWKLMTRHSTSEPEKADA